MSTPPGGESPARRLRLGATARDEVRPEHVGRRVTVRHRLPGDDGVSDVVGHLRAWEDDVLVVERRDGSTARVAADAVVASRLVPDPPVRRSARG